jgi:hypothetical protein
MDCKKLFTRKRNDRMEYGQKDVPDNFGTVSRDVEVGAAVVKLTANLSSSRPIEVVLDNDSTNKVVRFGNNGSKSKRMRAANALKKLDIGLSRSELEILNVGSSGGSNSNLMELQQKITALTTKYEHSGLGWY